ncbi:bifunctional UDP-N-acetylglucosamine diphosphorylase/glucosamine-1-phosphate N-acetyltransferase GlmU [Polycladidibacter stylochi]|uniref:bifunctional UDP-N-acetylglucosamine diphosphorylase/glucosamine-1-phosphate N-acetyltransferase GlmU n=1 Tax=Polycladidibacter stylochi TaxID=1807766 RepID=UPI00083285D1|nr:bifunctional UDP-N-acetylglucosamine diphosphorylase/glucosamine-1-phosphate N-acetyltransferase GlmU [Pseudovibrio stylochi]
MTQTDCLAIVLAAGMGTRMRSDKPKVMHEIGGLPLVGHVLSAVKQAGTAKAAVIVGPQMPQLIETVQKLTPDAVCYEQTERLGTAHAVMAARQAYEQHTGDILVLTADTPLITAQSLAKLRQELANGADVVVLGFHADDSTGYGRLLVENGQLTAIREHKDATEAEQQVKLCNSGILAFSSKHMAKLLDAVENNNNQQEYYLTDTVELANRFGLKVSTVTASEQEVMGINNRAQLAACEEVFQNRQRQHFMLEGVTLQAPNSVYFSHDTKLEGDITIEPNVVFAAGVSVASGATIRAFSHLEQAHVASGATVGPYARLRPGAQIGEGAHIGNFVEIKKAVVERGAKVNHLTYIGDARVGEKSNIGAGTITCNYDGYMKHHTDIGANCFIGSNSVLVAPVQLEDGAFTAAGSVITKNVPQDSLAVARAMQTNKIGLAAKMRQKLKAQLQRLKNKN